MRRIVIRRGEVLRGEETKGYLYSIVSVMEYAALLRGHSQWCIEYERECTTCHRKGIYTVASPRPLDTMEALEYVQHGTTDKPAECKCRQQVKLRYVVFSGFVRSRTDGDVSLVSCNELIRLYRVDPRECMRIDENTVDRSYLENCRRAAELQLAYLGPDHTGRYRADECPIYRTYF